MLAWLPFNNLNQKVIFCLLLSSFSLTASLIFFFNTPHLLNSIFAESTATYLAILLVVISITAFQYWIFRHLVIIPVNHLMETIGGTADGDELDLSNEIKIKSNDEFELLAKGYNGFLKQLQEMISGSRLQSVKVSMNTSQLQKVISETGIAFKNQEHKVEEILQLSNEAGHAVSDITQCGRSLEKSNTANMSEIRSAGEDIKSVESKLRAIEKQVSEFQFVVDQLKGNSKNIIDVLGLVQDFSDQTNLLALNASIEAARAGEAGRGFAVVADEVRSLSVKVSDATYQIDSNIQEMLKLVGHTHEAAGTIMSFVSETDTYFCNTSEKFQHMIEGFETASQEIREITQSLEGLSSINAHNFSLVEQINTLSHETKQEVELSSRYSQVQEQSSEQMLEQLSRFHVGSGGIESMLNKTREAAAVVQNAMDELSQIGVNLLDEHLVLANSDSRIQKFDASYTVQFETTMQPIFDSIIRENPEFAVACAFTKKGYCPAHNTKVSQPLSGDFEKDNAVSRHRRIYFDTHAEQRRAEQQSSFLLLTFIRDTGEIMNSISIPLYVNGVFWGNFCSGFSPEALLQKDN